MAEALLELIEITKTYPGVVALDRVSLAVRRGEVIGLIGENGAGKSTLMKVLGGVVEPTGGAIRIEGQERRSLSVADAIAAGIAFVHQELNLFDNLDVAANVFIGREPLRGGPLKLIDRQALVAQGAAAARPAGRGVRPGHAGLRAVARPKTAPGDRQGALARCAPRDHGRADLEPDHHRDRAAAAGDLGPQGAGRQRDLHLASPERGRRLRRPRGRPARRPGRGRARRRRDRSGCDDPVDDRPRSAARSTSSRPRRPAPARSRSSICARPPTRIGRSAWRSGAARSSVSRAWWAPGGPSWRGRSSASTLRLGGGLRLAGEPIVIRSPREAIDRGIYLVPEDRKRSSLLLDVSLTENISLPDLASYARADAGRPPARRPTTPSGRSASSTSRRPRSPPRSARSPAAINRRSCWRAGCRCSRG